MKSLKDIGSLSAREPFGRDGSYSIHYDLKFIRAVNEHSVKELFGKYSDLLWETGRHKYNVTSFVGEIDEILLGRKLSVFSQETLDFILGTLRERGNSNATINRKMAALSKLLRKAHKMGDIHSLPEFRRQKERAGRIRFLERDEETSLRGDRKAMPRQLQACSLSRRYRLPARRGARSDME